jgi:hypothetical protein
MDQTNVVKLDQPVKIARKHRKAKTTRQRCLPACCAG